MRLYLRGALHGTLTKNVTEQPHYPQLEVRTSSANPYAMVAAVRQALRRAHVPRAEIHRFTEAALNSTDTESSREICLEWVRLHCD